MEWRAKFFEQSALFSPIRAAASLFADCGAFPSPEAIDVALHARAGVRFVRKQPRERVLYDTRIVSEGVVPTRAGSWHDFLNALVWATFPRAKAALHKRQFALVVPHAPRRTREQDALALIDEGGVFCVRPEVRLVFGHAIYESFVMGWRTPRGAGLDLGEGRADEGEIDRRAAAAIADPRRLRSPAELSRAELGLPAIVPSP